VTLGIFAVPELADMAISRKSVAADRAAAVATSTQWDGVRDAMRHWRLILRCSGLGAMLGAVPGIGSAVIDWLAYGYAVKTEKKPELFGHGDIRGVIAAESSNNAKEGGHLIPTIAFGVPAGASMALLLSAFFMHGFTPGPEMLTKHIDVTYSIIWTLTISHLMAAVICLFASNVFAKLSLIRVGLLVPVVVPIVYLGAFNTNQSWGDLASVAIFGAIGWIMKQLGWPRPPLILGFVLGASFERYFFISNELFGASLFTRPVVVIVLAAAVWVVFTPLLRACRHLLAPGRRARWVMTDAPRLSANALFTLAVLAAAIAAIWLAQPWPDHAKLVPLAAAYAAAIFAAVGFSAQLLFRPPAGAPELPEDRAGQVDGPALALRGDDAADAVRLHWRAFRFFAWVVGSLGAMALCGMLPGLLLTMLLMTRLEFGESNRVAVMLSAGMTAMFWLVFGYVFSIPWPPSLLGDAVPWLRAASGLV